MGQHHWWWHVAHIDIDIAWESDALITCDLHDL